MTTQATEKRDSVLSGLRDRDWRLLIGGKLSSARDGRTEPVVDPSTGEEIASVPWGGAADVDVACREADAASAEWAALTVQERAAHVREFGRLIAERADELALLDSVDSGNPLPAMRAEVDFGLDHIDKWCALATALRGEVIPASRSNLHYTTYRPYGVVARIVPFNHPLLFAVTRPLAALLAGNTCVLKPAEQTPLVTLALGELAEQAFPAGVLSMITGGAEVGDALVTHPTVRRIGFIGGTKTGRRIPHRAAEHGVKNVTLELGGKNALIVMPDADFDAAVNGVVNGMNLGVSQGQSCGSTSRAFIHERLYDDFVDAVAERFRAVRVGRAYDPDVDMGPVISAAQLARVEHYIESGRQEARLVTGGGRPEGLNGGFFVEPTLFADVGTTATIAAEEIFGPVLSVASWNDYEEVVRAANSVEYGLTASVWTQDLTLGHKTAERLEAGYVWINETSTHYWGTPFGGTKESGVGREESLEELISYLEQKVIHVNFGTACDALERVLQRGGRSARRLSTPVSKREER
jgi:betaine-aldehyde dehydrogenase